MGRILTGFYSNGDKNFVSICMQCYSYVKAANQTSLKLTCGGGWKCFHDENSFLWSPIQGLFRGFLWRRSLMRMISGPSVNWLALVEWGLKTANVLISRNITDEVKCSFYVVF